MLASVMIHTRALYIVYYMDNDRQRRVIDRGLLYHRAVKLCQEQYSQGLSCSYELQD